LQPIVNSSTGGLTARTPGIFECTANIAIEDTSLGTLLTKYSPYQFRFYNTATTYWLLKWMRVKEYTGLNVQPETGAVIGYNMALELSISELVSGTPTIGRVLAPGATVPSIGV
jgi:hypothetical protein